MSLEASSAMLSYGSRPRGRNTSLTPSSPRICRRSCATSGTALCLAQRCHCLSYRILSQYRRYICIHFTSWRPPSSGSIHQRWPPYFVSSAVRPGKRRGIRPRLTSRLTGKKRNVEKNRLEPTEYRLDQLLLGSILFTIAIFLFPTVLAYYLVFASVCASDRILTQADAIRSVAS